MSQIDVFQAETLDETIELNALAPALRLAEGFKLSFVSCNARTQRQRLIAELRAHAGTQRA